MSGKKLRPITHGVIFTVLSLVSIVTLFPVLYTVFGSLKPTQEILTSGKLFPLHPSGMNFVKAVVSIDFFRYTMNSVVLCAVSVCGIIVLTSMTAFVLDRRPDLPGSKFMSALYVASIFISLPVVTIYPIFKLVISLRLNMTLLGLILVSMSGQCTFIFMIQGYLRGVPKEIDEAAVMDGCSFFRLYIQIIMPLIRPIIATVGLLSFRGIWNAYLMPSILTIGNNHLKPLTVAIVELKSSGKDATDLGLMLAGATISIIPMIVVYIIANKNFMQGLTTGSIKG